METSGTAATENAKRWRKIAHLIAALWVHRVPRDTVRGLTEAQWEIVAAAGGARPPSRQTVVYLIETLEKVLAVKGSSLKP